MRSNCLFWSLMKWFRHGGFIVMGQSEFGWWPHFMWSPDLKELYGFVPNVAPIGKTFPPPFFHGSVVREDISKYLHTE